MKQGGRLLRNDTQDRHLASTYTYTYHTFRNTYSDIYTKKDISGCYYSAIKMFVIMNFLKYLVMHIIG
ncbi:hypothetical protein ACRRTK_021991 [Alexandromys fortis]